ncbi:hypothetical protein BG015_003551, partial [Linnemannia schmuckeri]
MSDRSWSPPLDVDTRTLKSLSIIRARPEHLPAIHKIQILAYPGRTDFHESKDVFRSKMEAYPAGNFVALATYSVVTQDDTSTWVGEGDGGEVEEVEVEEEEREGEGEVVHGISVVEITETGPDGSSTTTTATTTTTTIGGETIEHVDVVRARTPDILEGTDDEDDTGDVSLKRSMGLDVPRTRHGHRHGRGQGSKSAGGGDGATTTASSASAAAAGEDEEKEDTTVLFQWEEPVGYLFSHPYSRESVTLHRMGAHAGTTAEEKSEASSKPKRIRLQGGGSAAGKGHDHSQEEEEEEETDFDHDQTMEKYYIHDCAIHPSWRGQGLASKLWKALEESLIPTRDPAGGGDGAGGEGASGDLVATEEEEEDTEGHEESASSDDGTAAAKETSSTTRRRGGGR